MPRVWWNLLMMAPCFVQGLWVARHESQMALLLLELIQQVQPGKKHLAKMAKIQISSKMPSSISIPGCTNVILNKCRSPKVLKTPVESLQSSPEKNLPPNEHGKATSDSADMHRLHLHPSFKLPFSCSGVNIWQNRSCFQDMLEIWLTNSKPETGTISFFTKIKPRTLCLCLSLTLDCSSTSNIFQYNDLLVMFGPNISRQVVIYIYI